MLTGQLFGPGGRDRNTAPEYFGSMGVAHGPLRRRHSGKGRAVPERPPSILIIRRLAAFNGAGFSVAVPAHARQLLEYLSIVGSRSAAGTSCPNRPAHGRTKGAHRSPAVNSSTHVSRVPSLASGEVNAPSTRRKSPQIRGACEL